MLSNLKAIKAFYKNHQNILEENYPGINLDILTENFVEIYKVSLNDYYLSTYKSFEVKLIHGTPLEYLKNFKFFYRSKFFVDKRVLIPRSESEILVGDALDFIEKNDKSELRVAEVGVGSFALGLSLLIDSTKPIRITGGDICTDALEVARINTKRLKYKLNQSHRVQLILSDRLEKFEGTFDLIISNPPYIKKSQLNLVHAQVLNNEPELALFLQDDEHDTWFSEFFNSVYDKLSEKGAFLMEGHEDNLNDLSEMAQKIFSRVELKKDYTGCLRFLHCFKEK